MKQQIKRVLQINALGETRVVEQEVRQKKRNKTPRFFLALATEVGFSIALPISLGALFGLWLDQKFASHPKYTLSFLFVGIFVSFANLFYIVKVFSKKDK